MEIRKFIGWFGSWLFSYFAGESGDIHGNDTPEEGTINDDDETILVPSFDTELEHDDQPGNKKRKATHDSIVIYDHEQGSSSASSSQPICQLDWLLSNDPGVFCMNEALRCKLRSLFARAIDVFTELKHDEIQPKKKRRMEVNQWLADVNRIRDEVQNLATDCKSIENFTSQVDELLQRGNFPHGYVLPDDSPIEFLLLSKNPAGEKFASNTAMILEWLKNNERCIVGVYGMGGVGKTTMLRWIYNEVLKQEDVFGRPYWVTVSQNSDELKLQNEIAKELGVDLSREGDDRKRAAILHKRLSTMGPTVLFLDDMWKWNPFLGKDIDFPIEGSNCKIILSSRSRKVCKEMGCKGFIIETKVLPEGEAWNLFVDKLGHYDKLTEEVKGIARLIAKECGGLPLAIATMARSMTDVVDVCVWNDALTELRQSSCEQSDMEEYVFSVLKYSYNRLNDQRLQNCFLSCILYPEDKMINCKTLIEDWIMEGLLDDVGSRSEQLNKGHTILTKLINSCLLEELSGIEYVKMHDLMRDLGIMITKVYPCFVTKSGHQLREVPEEEQWSQDLVKVSLSYNIIAEIPNGMAPLTPEITVLLLNNNPLRGIPESFLMHMRSLTVLNLSGTEIESLPESVSDLANLRALLLAYCSKLTYVPSLAKLSNLRVLDLDYAYKLEKALDGIENLKCLEKVTYLPWDVSDSTGFNKLIQSLPSSISCYKFWLHDLKLFNTVEEMWENIEDECYIFDREFENEVWVAGEIGDDETSYMLPATIEMVAMYKFDLNRRNLGDVFPTLGLATDLKMLSISWCPKIKVIFPLSDKQLSLPNLKYLQVSSCDAFEEIFESNINNHHNSVLALPNLVRVRLHSLPKLRRIFMNLHLCTSLEELDVSHCPELEEIFDGGAGNGSSSSTSQEGAETLVIDSMRACIPQPNPVSALPKLKILKLEDLPKLGSIYKDLHLCTSLELLKVMECPKIEGVAEEKLWCKDLVEVLLAGNDIKEIPNGMAPPTPALKLPNLKGNPLTGIPESFFMHMRAITVLDLSCTSIVRLPESVSDLANLRKLLLAECHKLTYVPSLAKLSNLEVLDLDYAEMLEKAPDGIEKLKCLKKVSYWPWDISDSTGFNKLIQSLPSSLSCYRFWLHDPKSFKTIGDVQDTDEAAEYYIYDMFGRYEEGVWVAGTVIEDDETTYMLPATIATLNIYRCDVNRRNLGDVFPYLTDLKDLNHLNISYCNGLKYMLSSSSSSPLGPQQGSFIEAMTLTSLPDLRGLIEFEGCSFSRLRCLYIKDCPKIKLIFPLSEKQLSLPNLFSVRLHSLPKLRRIYMNLHLCTSLEQLTVESCEELEEIFERDGRSSSSSSTLQGGTETLAVDPMNACIPHKPNPVSALPKLKIIILKDLPKLGSIYKDLHLCTSLKELEVMDCPKIERIFEAPEPILALPGLRKLKLLRLQYLSSIHKGLLLCTSLDNFSVEGCFKLKKVPLSDHLICDDSPPSLLSLPSESHNPELWELLQSKYSEDARLLSDFVQYHVKIEEHNQNQLKLKRKRSDLEGKTRDFTDCIDQVSLPASLLPAADEDKNNWLADQLLLPRLVLTEDEQNQISAWGASLSLS